MSDSTETPDRSSTPGRGQGNGEWLETKLAEALREWGYHAKCRETIMTLEADVIACREDKRDQPDDFIVAECKDWATRYIEDQHIIRLCLLAFAARAMPVLCHTTHLTNRAWKLAQVFDVRLLTNEDLHGDELPALTSVRPSYMLNRRNTTAFRAWIRAVTPGTRPPCKGWAEFPTEMFK